jgi:chromosomal replication initiation ATPase DnaA
MHITPATEWRRPTELRRRPLEVRVPADELRALLEETVARVFDVELDLIRLPTRGRAKVAIARQSAMYLAHVACGLSLTEAGELFGRDRTTAAHACQVVEERRENSDFDRALQLMENVTKVLMYTPVHR